MCLPLQTNGARARHAHTARAPSRNRCRIQKTSSRTRADDVSRNSLIQLTLQEALQAPEQPVERSANAIDHMDHMPVQPALLPMQPTAHALDTDHIALQSRQRLEADPASATAQTPIIDGEDMRCHESMDEPDEMPSPSPSPTTLGRRLGRTDLAVLLDLLVPEMMQGEYAYLKGQMIRRFDRAYVLGKAALLEVRASTPNLLHSSPQPPASGCAGVTSGWGVPTGASHPSPLSHQLSVLTGSAGAQKPLTCTCGWEDPSGS